MSPNYTITIEGFQPEWTELTQEGVQNCGKYANADVILECSRFVKNTELGFMGFCGYDHNL